MSSQEKLTKVIIEDTLKKLMDQPGYQSAVRDLIIFGTTNPVEITEDGEIIYESIWGKDSKKLIPVEVDDEQ